MFSANNNTIYYKLQELIKFRKLFSPLTQTISKALSIFQINTTEYFIYLIYFPSPSEKYQKSRDISEKNRCKKK